MPRFPLSKALLASFLMMGCKSLHRSRQYCGGWRIGKLSVPKSMLRPCSKEARRAAPPVRGMAGTIIYLLLVGEILLCQPRLRHLSLDECSRHSKNYRMCGLLPDSLLRPSSECDRSRLCRKAHHLEKANCFRGLSSLSSCQHAG